MALGKPYPSNSEGGDGTGKYGKCYHCPPSDIPRERVPPEAKAHPSAMTLGKSYPSNSEGDDGVMSLDTQHRDTGRWRCYHQPHQMLRPSAEIHLPTTYQIKLAKVRRRHRRCSSNRHNRHRNFCRLSKNLRQRRIAPAKIERVYSRTGAQACTRKPPSARRDG